MRHKTSTATKFYASFRMRLTNAASGDDVTTIAELIRQARNAKGWNQSELARRLNTTRQTVNHWETGYSAPSRKRAPLVAEILEIPLEALAGDPNRINVERVVSDSVRRIPMLDWVNAGRGALVEPYEIDGNHELVQIDIEVSNRAFALRVHGESMEPDFRNGDIIIVDPTVEPHSGQFVIAELLGPSPDPGPGEITFKQYRPRNGTPTFDLMPLNPDYPTITVNKNNPGKIVGTVVGHHRDLRH